MYKFPSRTKETGSILNGQSTLTLTGPVNGYRSFSETLLDGEQTYVCCTFGNHWLLATVTYQNQTVTLNQITTASLPGFESLQQLWALGATEIFVTFPEAFLNAISIRPEDFPQASNTLEENHAIAMGRGNYGAGVLIGENNLIFGGKGIALGFNVRTPSGCIAHSINDGISATDMLKTASSITYDGEETSLDLILVGSVNGDISTYLYDIALIAISGSGETKAWSGKFVCKHISWQFSLVGAPTLTVTASDPGTETWSAAITDGDPPIRITGDANKTLRWFCAARAIRAYYEPDNQG